MKNLQTLTIEELIEINAGESGWYWTMYYLARGLNYLNEAGKGNVMHSAG
jgi:hypothetical protein